MSAPIISVTVPSYNEEGNIAELHRRVSHVLDKLGKQWELILVDDGSTDGTWQEIIRLYDADKRVKGVRLSRNFGHQYALMAGMRAAGGQAVITADADLQHPPEIMEQLVAQWEQGHQVVQTIRMDPESYGLIKTLTSRVYYRLFKWLSGVNLEPGMADYRLLDRAVVDEISNFAEQGLFLRGIVQWVGYSATTVKYQAEDRFSGSTKYSVRKMLKLAWRGVSSFSNVPLRIGVSIGLLASFVSFVSVGYAIWGKLIAGEAVAGWASSVAIISFLFAVLFIYLGILGEYIGRITIEVRQRPRYLIRDRLGFDTGAVNAQRERISQTTRSAVG